MPETSRLKEVKSVGVRRPRSTDWSTAPVAERDNGPFTPQFLSHPPSFRRRACGLRPATHPGFNEPTSGSGIPAAESSAPDFLYSEDKSPSTSPAGSNAIALNRSCCPWPEQGARRFGLPLPWRGSMPSNGKWRRCYARCANLFEKSPKSGPQSPTRPSSPYSGRPSVRAGNVHARSAAAKRKRTGREESSLILDTASRVSG